MENLGVIQINGMMVFKFKTIWLNKLAQTAQIMNLDTALISTLKFHQKKAALIGEANHKWRIL